MSEQAGGMLGPRAQRWRDELRAETRPEFLAAVVQGSRARALGRGGGLALANPLG